MNTARALSAAGAVLLDPERRRFYVDVFLLLISGGGMHDGEKSED